MTAEFAVLSHEILKLMCEWATVSAELLTDNINSTKDVGRFNPAAAFNHRKRLRQMRIREQLEATRKFTKQEIVGTIENLIARGYVKPVSGNDNTNYILTPKGTVYKRENRL
jgi:hypothetical protein